MTKYLLLAASLALASCAAQKALPQYTEAEQAAQRGGISYWQSDSAKAVPKLSPVAQAKLEARRRRGQAPAPLAGDGGVRSLDSLVAIPYATPQPGRSIPFWQKVNPFRSKPTPPPNPLSQKEGMPRKCKGCTFNVVNGDQHNQQVGKKGQALGAGASNTQTGKKSGDIIKADSGSIVSKVAGPGNTQTTRGNNNAPTLTAPVQQAADWRATLAKYAGPVLAGAGTIVLVGGCIFLIVAYRRGKKLAA